jgi:hypothetical protein
MTGRKDPQGPNTKWLPDGWKQPVPVRVQEHRCGQCFGPLGKSSIRCKNEPKEARE